MELISVSRRRELIDQARDYAKCDLRDRYAVNADTVAAWLAGDAARIDAEVAKWREGLLTEVAGRSRTRRIRVASEPLSDYHRFVYAVSSAGVGAGDDLRWLPRRLTSVLALPGNDFFVLDGELVIFNVLDGHDDRAEIQLYDEPDVVKFCVDAFEAAWAVAVPHDRYVPSA